MLRLRLLSRMMEMWHITDNRAKAAQQRYRRHHDAKMREKTGFRVGQLEYVYLPPIPTPAANKMAAESYPILLPCALGRYRVTSITSYTVIVGPGGILNTIAADRVSLAQAHKQLQDDTVDDEHSQSALESSVRIPR